MEVEAPQVQEATSPQATTGDDGIRTHPHVYSFPEKWSTPPNFKKQLLQRLKPEAGDKQTKARAEEFAAELQRKRADLLQDLQAPPVSDVSDSVTRKFNDYVALLLALASSATAAAGELSKSSSAAPEVAALHPSKLRDAVTFEWQDVLLASQAVKAADAVFELASIVTAVSGWRMRRAAYICKDSRPGVDSSSASQAYRLVLQAAGGFQFIRDSCSQLLEASCASADCTQEAASSHLNLCLADAQAITTLRAMAKSNAPSLVAGLASDTAALYRAAERSARGAPFSRPAAKAAQYAEYKAAVFQAYACCFQGLVSLKETQAGNALRLLEEAKRLAAGAIPLAAAYNKAEPSTPAATHTEFDRDLNICIDAALARAKRENDTVYFQKVPRELPRLVEGRRLVNATPLVLPQPPESLKELFSLDAFAASPVPIPELAPGPAAPPSTSAAAAPVVQGNADAKPVAAASHPEEESAACSCCRWLLVIIAMPLLVILSVVGIIVWLVLLPVKIICCPLGCVVQLMADVIEYLLKAPFRGLLWASGKPWKAHKVADVESQR